MNVREAALRILRAHAGGRMFIDETFQAEAPSGLGAADRGLLAQIVFGVARRKRTLDHLVRKLSGRELKRIHPRLLDVLRIGYFQVLFLDRVPDYAASSESVNLARKVSAKSAGFVNALMRALIREIEQREATEGPAERFLRIRGDRGILFTKAVLPSGKENPVHALAVTESYPDWMLSRWIQAHGVDAAAKLCRAGNSTLPVAVRVNHRRVTREELRSHLAAEGVTSKNGRLSCALVLESPGDVTRLESFRKGEFQVQDTAAMEVVPVLDPSEGERVLDACASPGGKTSQMAEVASRSRITAADLTGDKTDRIRDTLGRLGHESVRVVCADMRHPSFAPGFDAVLVDAPCTNTGVLARRADARWRVRASDIERLPPLQGAILEGGSRTLAPGGRIVYSTCSIEPEENEGVVQGFLQRRPDLKLESSRVILPTEDHGGGFVARMVRT